MPATVIAERIGWSRSIRVLSARVAELRPAYLPPDPASRTVYEAGEIAQCDLWFPPVQVPVGFGQTRRPTQLPVLTMVTGYSRWLSGLLIPSRTAADLFAGWWQLIERLGAVPRVLVWDGEGAIGRWRGGRVELTDECQAFRGTLAAKVVVLKPREPEHKGIIERAHDYLERSFLPGRSFTGPDDFNAQLQQWLKLVNARPVAAAGVGLRPNRPDHRRPAGDARAAAGRAVDRVARRPAAATRPLRAPGLQRLLGASERDRSPHRGHRRPAPRGGPLRRPGRRRPRCNERIWGWHQTVSDPEHVAAATALRRQRVGVLRPVPEPDVQIRCLDDYDTALNTGLGLGDHLDGGVA
jgi:transposase